MYRLTILAVCAACFLLAAAGGFAATSQYKGPMYWSCPCDGSSSYSAGWRENWFDKSTSGVSDTAITFIDNGVYGYSWHGTVRNTAAHQRTYASTSYVKKGYCKFYAGTGFTGTCTVWG